MAPPSKSKSKTRRTHYKSRKGCQQCKQRHMKCDEQQPSCLQCSMTGRSCVYVYARSNNVQALRSSQVPKCTPSPASGASPADQPPKSRSCSCSCSCLVAQPVTRSNPASPSDSVMQEVPQQIFDLGHLALLHHLENDLMKPANFYLVPDKEDARKLLRMIVTCACSTPYLMDAVLAFAALHLSVLASDVTSQHHYRHQAVHLHTRALSLYNAAGPEITEQNCTALFLYSSFIGMYMLHDTVTSQTDLLELLDKFIQFVGLYHGVGIVANRAWPIIRDSELSSIVDLIDAADTLEQPPQNICDDLFGLLETAVDRLGPSSFQACHDAVQSLWWVCSRYSLLSAPINRHIVLAWPVHISTEYLQMLRERQPEALVIMAYWAVLLHYERDFWIFGHGGRFLIEVISKYLGPSWDKWMALPRDIINADSI
ncbi:hypothetical protein GGR58DRAFT_348300 [Xylaria digitata]|nr:hypothetical protein GGR58DRAFT_348300 [Xylaria digitata]